MDTITPVLTASYTPAEAERGKFTVVDMSTIAGYEALSGSQGFRGQRYAVLVKLVEPIALSSGSITLSAGSITANVCSIGVNNWNDLINETYSGTALSANVSIDNWPVDILTLPNETYIASDMYGPTATHFAFSTAAPLRMLEIFNTSGNTAYLLLSTATFDSLTAKGIPLLQSSFYSIEREITEITLGADGIDSDLRVIGHYRI